MFQIKYKQKFTINLNVKLVLFLFTIIGSVVVPALLLSGMFFANAEPIGNTQVVSNKQALLSSLADSDPGWSAHTDKNCRFKGNPYACDDNVEFKNGCNPDSGKMCMCYNWVLDADGYHYGVTTQDDYTKCGYDQAVANCNGQSGVLKTWPGCNNPYRCPGTPVTPSPTPVVTTPAPSARCDQLEPKGVRDLGNGGKNACFIAHGSFFNGAKADHVDVTFRSGNGETLSNRTTGLGGATNGVVSNLECYDFTIPGNYQITATYYGVGDLSVDNSSDSCIKKISVDVPSTSVPPTTTVPPRTTTPPVTTVPVTTVVPTTPIAQKYTLSVKAKCTDNDAINILTDQAAGQPKLGVRLYDVNQSSPRLDKQLPYTFGELVSGSNVILVPDVLNKVLTNGATAQLTSKANLTLGNTVSRIDLNTVANIDFNKGYHYTINPTQNATLEYLYDHCNVPPTQTPTPTPSPTPTVPVTTVVPTTPVATTTPPVTTVPVTTVVPTTPVYKTAKCTGIEKVVVPNVTDICYKAKGNFVNTNADKVRITFDQNDQSASGDYKFEANSTGDVTSAAICHYFDTPGTYKVSAVFTATDLTPVESNNDACTTSITIPGTTTVAPTVSPTVLGVSTGPTPTVVPTTKVVSTLTNTGQSTTLWSIFFGVVLILSTAIIVARRRNTVHEDTFEDTYLNYYANAPVLPTEPVAPVSDPYDLMNYKFTNDLSNTTVGKTTPDVSSIEESSINIPSVPTENIHKTDSSNGRLI